MLSVNVMGQLSALSRIASIRAYQMSQEPHQLFRVLEAPLTHIQSLYAPSDKFFRVEGRVPWPDEKRAEYHLQDVWAGRRFLGRFGCRRRRNAVRRGYIEGH